MKTLSAVLVLIAIAPMIITTGARAQTSITVPGVPTMDPNGPVGLSQLVQPSQSTQPITSMPLPRPPTSQAAPGSFMPLHKAQAAPVLPRKKATANIPPNPIFPAGVGGHARTVDTAH